MFLHYVQSDISESCLTFWLRHQPRWLTAGLTGSKLTNKLILASVSPGIAPTSGEFAQSRIRKLFKWSSSISKQRRAALRLFNLSNRQSWTQFKSPSCAPVSSSAALSNYSSTNRLLFLVLVVFRQTRRYNGALLPLLIDEGSSPIYFHTRATGPEKRYHFCCGSPSCVAKE